MVVLASCVVLLLETPSIDFATGVLVALALLAAGTAGLLARRVRRVPDGFIPAAVVRSRRFVLGALAALALFGAYLAMLFAAPLLLLQDHDWSPTQIGLVLLPAAILGALTARAVAQLIVTHDPFRLTAVLALVSAAGLLLAGAEDGAPVATTLGWGWPWPGSCRPRLPYSTAFRWCSSPRSGASPPVSSSSCSWSAAPSARRPLPASRSRSGWRARWPASRRSRPQGRVCRWPRARASRVPAP